METIVSLTPLTLFKRIKCNVPINHKQCDLTILIIQSMLRPDMTKIKPAANDEKVTIF